MADQEQLPRILYIPYLDLKEVDVRLRAATTEAAERDEIELTIAKTQSLPTDISSFDLVIGPSEIHQPDTDVGFLDLDWVFDDFVPPEFIGSPGLAWLGFDQPGGLFDRDVDGWAKLFGAMGRPPVEMPFGPLDPPTGGLGGRQGGGGENSKGVWLLILRFLENRAAKGKGGTPVSGQVSEAILVLDAFFKGFAKAKEDRRKAQEQKGAGQDKNEQQGQSGKDSGKQDSQGEKKTGTDGSKKDPKDDKKKPKKKAMGTDDQGTDYLLAVNQFVEKIQLHELWESIRSGRLDVEETDLDRERIHWLVLRNHNGVTQERHFSTPYDDPRGHWLRYWLSMKYGDGGDESFYYWVLWRKGAPIDPIDILMSANKNVIVAAKRRGGSERLQLHFA